jgi:hypothetical protein
MQNKVYDHPSVLLQQNLVNGLNPRVLAGTHLDRLDRCNRGQPALLKQAINSEEAIFSIQTYLQLALKSPLGNSIMELAEQYPDIESLTAALGGSKDAEVMAYTITYLNSSLSEHCQTETFSLILGGTRQDFLERAALTHVIDIVYRLAVPHLLLSKSSISSACVAWYSSLDM